MSTDYYGHPQQYVDTLSPQLLINKELWGPVIKSADGLTTINLSGAAPAGTLTGATLAANVLASSLTSVGVLAGLAVAGAALSVNRDAIAAVSTDAIALKNDTPSTAIATVQQPGRLRFRSHVWNSTAVAADNTDDWWIESLPASGATPSGALLFRSSLNGAGSTIPVSFTSAGGVTALGNIVTSASVFVAAAGVFVWSARSILSSPANGQFNVSNQALSAGVGFDVTTDATLKVRTRAQTGYATVDALGYKVSGVAGANFGPAAVASITVVNGLITAIS